MAPILSLTNPRSDQPTYASRRDATIILFGVSPATKATCDDVAHGLSVAVLEARHLQAACRMLRTTPAGAFVVGSSTRPWDRAIAIEHALRRGVRVIDEDAEDIDAALERTFEAPPGSRRSGT
jgi:hypothetical protein